VTPETLKALKGSIRKWEKIVLGTGRDEGALNCPLCRLFIEDDCIGCPVFERTSKPACGDSPYGDWEYLTPRTDVAQDPLQREAAFQMLQFLRELLPEKPEQSPARRKRS
jgi:hypothetical protein